MFVGNSLSACAVAFTKLSIISSYLRVFPHQSLRVTMFITMAITIGLMLASIPVTVFQCDPVRAAWDFTITDGRVSDAQVSNDFSLSGRGLHALMEILMHYSLHAGQCLG